jgi:hypothetical protein
MLDCIHSRYERIGRFRNSGAIVIVSPGGMDWAAGPGSGETTTALDGAYYILVHSLLAHPVGTVAGFPRVRERYVATAEPVPAGADVPAIIAEAKRLTGWNWETLANVLGRTRQAVHAWTLGGEIKQENLDRLSQLYATLRFIDRGSAEENRALLAQPVRDGRTATELLKAGEFEAVRKLLGQGQARPQWSIIARTRVEPGTHWTERLGLEGEESNPDIEFVPRGEKKRLTLRRR